MTEKQMSVSPTDSTESRDSTWHPVVAPKSLYIHIPFCRRRCGYCNFSLVANRDYLVERFLRALAQEISWLDRSYPLQTLFLGGGTPSHLTSSQLRELKRVLATRFEFDQAAEVTAECNPNDLGTEKSEALAEFGINRVSLGVQSFNAAKLERLERDHRAEDVAKAVLRSRRFARSISLDLIFAAPEESLAQWQQDLRSALELDPDHLSVYELTYEKGTQFWNRLQHQKLNEADEDLRAEMYELAMTEIEKAGLKQYEISSFAKPNHLCGHNEIYWMGEPYFAFGPGASRYIDGCRQTNHQSTMQYIKLIEAGQRPIAISEKLSPVDSARELLAIGLRRVAGLDDAVFRARTKCSISDLLGDQARIWIELGLLSREGAIWKLTPPGRMVGDWLATKIISKV
jgi:oxygen-independent coproporphyrinogen-3 oxidase